MLILTGSYESGVTIFKASVLFNEPVIFPTDTIYGVGAPISSVKANEKIFSIKKRPLSQPLPVLVSSYEMLETIAHVTSDEKKWLASVWPGNYTIIFRAKEHVNSIYTHSSTIAVRLVSGQLADVITAISSPITATSINLHGMPPITKAQNIYEAFKDSVDFMLWGSSGDRSSTIIDISEGKYKKIRFT